MNTCLSVVTKVVTGHGLVINLFLIHKAAYPQEGEEEEWWRRGCEQEDI